MTGFMIRYLGYFGPDKKTADLKFEPGLNVICGASETGKSLIAETLDFMLGQEKPVRDIPERDGYDRVRLMLESQNFPPLTLDRSVDGGHFRAYEELAFEKEPQSEANILKWKHSAARQDTLSYALLERSGLVSKILRRNAGGEIRTLSFRDLARLCIVSEEEIQRRSSPLITGQFTTKTAETSAFKLLITGTDDSALVAVAESAEARDLDSGKIELLDEMIEELQSELDEQGADESELRAQIDRLQESISEQNSALANVQRALDDLLEQRGEAAESLRSIKSRTVEINELIARFELLDAHYETDLKRLEAIHESGSLFVHLEQKQCPLCGANPGDQHLDTDCEGNTEAVVQAADAEIVKINLLRNELGGTIESLQQERKNINDNVSQHKERYDYCENQLNEIAAPAVSDERASYNQLNSARTDVRIALDKIDRLKRLSDQRKLLSQEEFDGDKKSSPINTKISTNVLDEFSKTIERILEEWHYPNPSRVFFDESKLDFQIDGKERGSSGKGLRSITHAAVSVGLMEFCREKGLPHPGFVVLDSPLLAYWKPEGEEDDLSGTDLDEMFYRYLLGLSRDNQVIILENKHPPEFVVKEANVTVFTKNPHQGRYGLFPAL